MKIYFNAAISAKPEHEKYYERIVGKLCDLGHEVCADDITLARVLEGRREF